MAIKVAINGFGRMGRLFLRAAWANPALDIVLINEPILNLTAAAHLLEFDSTHGRFEKDNIQITDDHSQQIHIGGQSITYSQQKVLDETDFSGIDLLVECSGLYRKSAMYDNILGTSANGQVKKVLVACPIKDADTLNIVYGVNHHLYQSQHNHLVTAASCTTNCLAPVMKVLLDSVGVVRGSMTTIHDITATQNIVDGAHKDLRRARAAGESLVPTSSGSTTAIMKIFPELEGKLDGLAVRVPLLNASLVDLVVEVGEDVTVEQINQLFKQAADTTLAGILGYEERPLVSVDYKDDTRSGIIDALSTLVTDKRLVKILAWYDNEINYVERMNDVATMIATDLA
ncbi:MAG: glyceraldehyde 3-phosphate dehydrogenase [Phenylobacterium sp.]|jgi:glyceraldehyde 3-phosphate dehydrogenase